MANPSTAIDLISDDDDDDIVIDEERNRQNRQHVQRLRTGLSASQHSTNTTNTKTVHSTFHSRVEQHLATDNHHQSVPGIVVSNARFVKKRVISYLLLDSDSDYSDVEFCDDPAERPQQSDKSGQGSHSVMNQSGAVTSCEKEQTSTRADTAQPQALEHRDLEDDGSVASARNKSVSRIVREQGAGSPEMQEGRVSLEKEAVGEIPVSLDLEVDEVDEVGVEGCSDLEADQLDDTSDTGTLEDKSEKDFEDSAAEKNVESDSSKTAIWKNARSSNDVDDRDGLDLVVEEGEDSEGSSDDKEIIMDEGDEHHQEPRIITKSRSFVTERNGVAVFLSSSESDTEMDLAAGQSNKNKSKSAELVTMTAKEREIVNDKTVIYTRSVTLTDRDEDMEEDPATLESKSSVSSFAEDKAAMATSGNDVEINEPDPQDGTKHPDPKLSIENYKAAESHVVHCRPHVYSANGQQNNMSGLKRKLSEPKPCTSKRLLESNILNVRLLKSSKDSPVVKDQNEAFRRYSDRSPFVEVNWSSDRSPGVEVSRSSGESTSKDTEPVAWPVLLVKASEQGIMFSTVLNNGQVDDPQPRNTLPKQPVPVDDPQPRNILPKPELGPVDDPQPRNILPKPEPGPVDDPQPQNTLPKPEPGPVDDPQPQNTLPKPEPGPCRKNKNVIWSVETFPVEAKTLRDRKFQKCLREARPSLKLLKFLLNAQDVKFSVCAECGDSVLKNPSLRMGRSCITTFNVNGILMTTMQELARSSVINCDIGKHFLLDEKTFPAVWSAVKGKHTWNKWKSDHAVSLVFVLYVIEDALLHNDLSLSQRSRTSLIGVLAVDFKLVGFDHSPKHKSFSLTHQSCSYVTFDKGVFEAHQTVANYLPDKHTSVPMKTSSGAAGSMRTGLENSEKVVVVSVDNSSDANSSQHPEARRLVYASADTTSARMPSRGGSMVNRCSKLELFFHSSWYSILNFPERNNAIFDHSLHLMSPMCECRKLSKQDMMERALWTTFYEKKTRQDRNVENDETINNLGVLRFMGHNVFCFLDVNCHVYVSLDELQQRGLLPLDVNMSTLTETVMDYLVRKVHVRLIMAQEGSFLQTYFGEVHCKYLFTTYALQKLYQHLSRQDFQYDRHSKAIFYMMPLGHHCAWTLQVTPPTSQLHCIPHYERPDGKQQRAAMIFSSSSPGTLTEERKVFCDGGGGTPPAMKQVTESLNTALRQTIRLFNLEHHAQPFCDCNVNATHLHKYRILTFQDIEFNHVTHMTLAGVQLHCWKRPYGFFVSCAELHAKGLLCRHINYSSDTLVRAAKTLSETMNGQVAYSYFLEHELVFLSILPADVLKLPDRARLISLNVAKVHFLLRYRSTIEKFHIKLWRHCCPREDEAEHQEVQSRETPIVAGTVGTSAVQSSSSGKEVADNDEIMIVDDDAADDDDSLSLTLEQEDDLEEDVSEGTCERQLGGVPQSSLSSISTQAVTGVPPSNVTGISTPAATSVTGISTPAATSVTGISTPAATSVTGISTPAVPSAVTNVSIPMAASVLPSSPTGISTPPVTGVPPSSEATLATPVTTVSVAGVTNTQTSVLTEQQTSENECNPHGTVNFRQTCSCPERKPGLFPSFSFLQCTYTSQTHFTILEHVGQVVINNKLIFSFNRAGQVFFSFLELKNITGFRYLMQKTLVDKLSQEERQMIVEFLGVDCEDLNSYDDFLVSAKDLQEAINTIYLHQIGHICPNPQSLAHFVQKRDFNMKHVQSAWMRGFQWHKDLQVACRRSLTNSGSSRQSQSGNKLEKSWLNSPAGPSESAAEQEERSTSRKMAKTCESGGMVFVKSVVESVGAAGVQREAEETVEFISMSPVDWQSVVVKQEPDWEQGSSAHDVKSVTGSHECDCCDVKQEADTKEAVEGCNCSEEHHQQHSSAHGCVTLTFCQMNAIPKVGCGEQKAFVRPAHKVRVKDIQASAILEGVVLDSLGTSVKIAGEDKIKEFLGDSSQQYQVLLTGVLMANDCQYVCFSMERLLYVNWGEVVLHLDVPKDREIIFRQAQRLHAFLYKLPPYLNDLLSRRYGNDLETLNSAPWVCVNTLVAIYNLGSGMLDREKMLKRFVDVTPDSFLFPTFLLIKV